MYSISSNVYIFFSLQLYYSRKIVPHKSSHPNCTHIFLSFYFSSSLIFLFFLSFYSFIFFQLTLHFSLYTILHIYNSLTLYPLFFFFIWFVFLLFYFSIFIHSSSQLLYSIFALALVHKSLQAQLDCRMRSLKEQVSKCVAAAAAATYWYLLHPEMCMGLINLRIHTGFLIYIFPTFSHSLGILYTSRGQTTAVLSWYSSAYTHR